MFLAPSVCLWANHAVSIFVLYPLSGSWLTKAAGFKGFHSASCPSSCSLFLYLCRLQGVEGKHLGTKEFVQISTEHPVKSIQNHALCSISLCLTQLKSSSLVDRELKVTAVFSCGLTLTLHCCLWAVLGVGVIVVLAFFMVLLVICI